MRKPSISQSTVKNHHVRKDRRVWQNLDSVPSPPGSGIAPSLASVGQRQFSPSYRVKPNHGPAIGSLECDDLVFPNQIIKHIGRNHLFQAVCKNNIHEAVVHGTTSLAGTRLLTNCSFANSLSLIIFLPVSAAQQDNAQIPTPCGRANLGEVRKAPVQAGKG